MPGTLKDNKEKGFTDNNRASRSGSGSSTGSPSSLNDRNSLSQSPNRSISPQVSRLDKRASTSPRKDTTISSSNKSPRKGSSSSHEDKATRLRTAESEEAMQGYLSASSYEDVKARKRKAAPWKRKGGKREKKDKERNKITSTITTTKNPTYTGGHPVENDRGRAKHSILLATSSPKSPQKEKQIINPEPGFRLPDKSNRSQNRSQSIKLSPHRSRPTLGNVEPIKQSADDQLLGFRPKIISPKQNSGPKDSNSKYPPAALKPKSPSRKRHLRSKSFGSDNTIS